MSTRARQIVIDTFETFMETEPEAAEALLEKVRDIILYRLEKETIEMEPSALGVVSTGREFSPDEFISFATEESAEPDFDLEKDA